MEDFLVAVAEGRDHDARHVRGSLYDRPAFLAAGFHPPPDFEHGCQLGGLCRADAVHPHQLAGRPYGKRAERACIPQDVPGQVHCAQPRGATPQGEGEQFGFGQRLRPPEEQFLPGAVIGKPFPDRREASVLAGHLLTPR